MQYLLMVAMIAAATAMSVSSARAHWAPAPERFPWANPGAVRWTINYRTMNEQHVQALLEAHFNLIQGGGFTPEGMQLATEAGCHRMAYICSRTIYHEQLFPEHPELRDAAILTPEGEYKVIYNNPARYAGCFNRPAWLEYIKGRVDDLAARGLDCIFFDNPMTWECYCPTCRQLFREYSKQHTGTEYELGAEGTPAELERWFTLDTALKFFTRVRDYAHEREQPMFIVANNLTYWLVDQGLTDGLFTEAGGQAPFGRDMAGYKIGLAASHGKPTAILTYIPGEVRMARGIKRYSAPSASERWYGAPIAEEYAAGCAMGLALGGNYLPNFSLEMERHILDFTKPEEDRRILEACAKYAEFAERWEKLYAGQQPGSRVGVLFDLSEGPRVGDILGTRRGPTNTLLWYLQAQGIPADVVVNTDLEGERLAGFKALVIDGAPMLSPAEMAGLRAFVEAGGTAVISGALSIRDRFEPPEKSRSISEFLPGCTDSLVEQRSALDLEMDGYVPDGGRIKCPTEGSASMTFQGEAGRWLISVQYLDESDGQSSFELLLNDRQVGAWVADQDDDTWRSFTCEALDLQPGDRILVRARQGGGEYARLNSLTLRTARDGGGAFEQPLGRGKVVQVAGPLEAALPEEQQQALEVIRAVSPVTGRWPDSVLVNLLWQPDPGVLGVHLVNFDYEYGEGYVLQAIRPTPEITLTVQDPRCRTARLISPDGEPRDLALADGTLVVPPLRNYAVVLLAAEPASIEALGE